MFLRPILLSLVLLSGAARADPLAVRQDLASPDQTTRFESTTFVLDTDADRDVAIQNIAATYRKDLAANPDLERGFELVEPEKGGPANAVDPAREALEKVAGKNAVIQRRVLKPETFKAMAEAFKSLPREKQVVRLALVRGFVNGGITTFSLVAAQGVPLPVAAGAGLIVALISGGFQRYSVETGQMLLKSFVRSAFPTSPFAKAWATHASPYFRWYLIEFGFTEAIELFLRLNGQDGDQDYKHTAWRDAGTAAMAVAGQGLWDIAIAKERDAKAALGLSEEILKNVHLRADLLGLGISMLAVTVTLSRVTHLPFVSWAVFAGMTASGAYYLFKVVPKNLKCARLLATAARSATADSNGEPAAPDIGAITSN